MSDTPSKGEAEARRERPRRRPPVVVWGSQGEVVILVLASRPLGWKQPWVRLLKKGRERLTSQLPLVVLRETRCVQEA